MHPKRRGRLYLALFGLVAIGGTIAALLMAMEQNLNLFYPPNEIVDGTAPAGQTIRGGGMVVDGSVQRSGEGLEVSFVLTDHQGSDFTVRYEGILPDLFREGQGILVQGQIDQAGVFQAHEVLAKHDENYMPPELMDLASGND